MVIPGKKADRKPVNKKRFPKKLLDNFDITNVNGDGNCFFRAIAELLLEDENKYPIIKLFIINYVFLNRDHYAILCKEGVIEVRSGNDDADVILNPTIVDFLKMIASDRIWGNEGSILEISNSLGIRLLIFCYWFDRLVSHDFRIET
ncbi:Protein of unknown function [Cotesia congregata]|uniref:OTU domain-containing protein n=1 Tax=Cotesia congregata TaxID=51543 RepID=A0A8J2HUI2_COTCN|nr:Protein of unknown function [Cotesia congregata]